MKDIYDLDTDNDKLVFPFTQKPFYVCEGMRIEYDSPIGMQTALLIKAGLVEFNDYEN
tara:strand:+ start:64 stop:237 length:174 start_codon:yes stop_codon:yes gene_type:complete